MLLRLARFLVPVLPDPVSFQIVRGLAAMTRPLTPTVTERAALAKARRFHYPGAHRNTAWEWGESGPLVVLVHGWGGSSAQMAPLAAHLADQGFHSIALDIRGHGDSPLRHTRWEYLLDDVKGLQDVLGQSVHAYVAHSAGALTTMAGRAIKGLRAARYVCICAPSHPFPPIDVVQKKLAPQTTVMDRYRDFIAAQFQSTWETLLTGVSYAGAGHDLLLFYDESDRFVPHHEGDKIHGLCPGSRLLKTTGYSHTRVLSSPELKTAVAAFLQEAVITAG